MAHFFKKTLKNIEQEVDSQTWRQRCEEKTDHPSRSVGW